MDEYQHRICRAIDFVERNLSRDFSIQEVAKAAGFSSFHFQRLFRAAIGESVGQFVRRIRLESAARRLVNNPREDITNTAIRLGFSSSKNFAKAFRVHFDCSPTEFRKRFLNQQKGGGPGNDADLASSVPAAEALMTLRSKPFDLKRIKSHVEVKMMEPVRVVYHRHFGSYNDAAVQTAFDQLQQWAVARGRIDPTYLGIPWDDVLVSPTRKCRFDACVVVENDFFGGQKKNWQDIPGGLFAVYSCSIENHDFERPWDELMWGLVA
ncbi:MAG: helix-turn-helix domain-containing protein [Pirellulaceae bacterium]|nr:helix-turn-helix domain-containing protein [Pirellulaceae bacterium]